MSPALVISKREIRTYFNSPVAYIVVTVFTIVFGFFFFNNLFVEKQADMRGFFSLAPLMFCFFLLLSIIILLNSQFYVFLAGRTGRLLALAAIPFHLLFHLYNGISFLIGGARHLARRILSPEAKDLPISPDR